LKGSLKGRGVILREGIYGLLGQKGRNYYLGWELKGIQVKETKLLGFSRKGRKEERPYLGQFLKGLKGNKVGVRLGEKVFRGE